jgi:hypothetical protein
MFRYYSLWLGYILVSNRKLSNPSSLYQEPPFLILFPPYIRARESPLPRSRTENVNGFGNDFESSSTDWMSSEHNPITKIGLMSQLRSQDGSNQGLEIYLYRAIISLTYLRLAMVVNINRF